ncbi:MAG: sigma-70 family RNA polymerase sigma factor [Acidobacteriota bacterium]
MDGTVEQVMGQAAHEEPAVGEWVLVRRARSGDLAAFEELYRTHAGRVHALCRRLCGGEARAEELTQEVFVRAWEKLAAFRGESAFSTWLHRMAVNAALMERRSSGRRERRERAEEDLSGYEARPERSPERAVDLERAVAALPEGARRVFVLHDVEGYAHEEMASLLGITVGATKAQLHRARRLLREALA